MTINATNITMRIGVGGALQHPPNPIDIGADWIFLGDSQTAGRALETSVESHVDAFVNIWNQTNTTSISPEVNGVGGRTIDGTNTAYSGIAGRSTATLVHFQESGSQGAPQDTASNFATLFTDFVNDIDTDSSSAVISTETAYSFEEIDGSGRYWPAYNAAMRAEIATLAGLGITVYVAEVDRNITELVVQKRVELGTTAGQQAVFGDTNDVLGNHYTGLGNLMVALSIYDALGYNLSNLDLSNIPSGDISDADKALCISIIGAF